MPAITAVTLVHRGEDPPETTHTVAKPKSPTPAADTEDEKPTTKVTKVAKVTEDESIGVKPTTTKIHLSTSAGQTGTTSGVIDDIKNVASGCVDSLTSANCKDGPTRAYWYLLFLILVPVIIIVWLCVRQRRKNKKKKKKERAQSGAG